MFLFNHLNLIFDQFTELMKKIFTLLLVTVLLSQFAIAGEVILQDSKILIAFDSNTGSLIRMVNKSTGWVIERRPELGMSFRLLVPFPSRRYNFIYGQKQIAEKIEKVSDNEVKIEWQNLISELGGGLPITFIETVTLHDGQVSFGATVENRSSYTIETIDYPYFGDLNPPDRGSSLHVRSMRYDNLDNVEVYPHFSNSKGYWGDFYPTKTFESTYSMYCLIQSQKEGLYVEMNSPNQPYLLEYTFEQHPGDESSVTNKVPKEDNIPGKPLFGDNNAAEVPVHLEFRTCHFVFAHPNSIIKLVPVVLESYNGGWHSGVDLYKKWRATWYKQPQLPDWIKGVTSWQQLQINSPEQNYGVKYSELVKYGEACSKNGVKAIQLVGWNKGGQDGGNPSMDTDPGLGTWQELHDAIKKIQALGVKIILFDKFLWADMTTEWYKTELYKYDVVDPYGIPYQSGGYSYFTPTQLAGINNHQMAVMDLLDPVYRNIATSEFKKALALGAAGFLYDEVCVQPPNHAYNFAEGHGYNPPGYIYAGAELLSKQLHAAADSAERDFLFCGEGPQDWLTQFYPLSYTRINASSTPIERYIDPEAPIMAAVNGFDDREMINLCLLDRYIIEYEPYNFKGKLSDFPLTLSYGKKMDLLRKKYKAYVWGAEFRDTKGAKVSADGSFKYSVFITKTGKRAVVIINMEENKRITAKVEIPNSGKMVTATPEHPKAIKTNGAVIIPARSAVIVMEQ